MKPINALVDELCSITGVNKTVAAKLLKACDNNIELAVNMHMEGLLIDDSVKLDETGEPEVRPPIQQKREIMVEGPDQISYYFSGRKRKARSVFDKFRDFEAETKRQEEALLAEEGSCSGGSSNSSLPDTCLTAKRKKKTLEDLFRPPLDLIFRGSFQLARDASVAAVKWLMVNIQDSSEFSCQVLNRDVWSNEAVKTIIKEHFIFWQVYHDSEDGQRYMNFYSVKEWPYVAIIDPRTGENIITWTKLDQYTFCELVTEFLSQHSTLGSPSVQNPLVSKRKEPHCADVPQPIHEADENAQIEAAIKASLEEVHSSLCVEDDRDDNQEESSDNLETFDSDSGDEFVTPKELSNNKNETVHAGQELSESDGPVEINSEIYTTEKSWKSYLGPEDDPASRLMIRFPDGTKDVITMPGSSKLMALILYVNKKGYSNEQYELVTNFPRRRVSYMDYGMTLKASGLFPQDTIFVQAR